MSDHVPNQGEWVQDGVGIYTAAYLYPVEGDGYRIWHCNYIDAEFCTEPRGMGKESDRDPRLKLWQLVPQLKQA